MSFRICFPWLQRTPSHGSFDHCDQLLIVCFDSPGADELWYRVAEDAPQPSDDPLLNQCLRFDISSFEISLELDQIARLLTLDPTPAWSKSRVVPVGVV